jgi:hypothetical protein
MLVTGMGPGETLDVRGCDLDTAGRPWTYTPASHETQHHGHERVIYLGPRARATIKPRSSSRARRPASSAP